MFVISCCLIVILFRYCVFVVDLMFVGWCACVYCFGFCGC